MSNTNSAKQDRRWGWHQGNMHARDIILNGNMSEPLQKFTVTGPVTQTSGLITLNHATVPILLTLPNPSYVGQKLIIKDISAAVHVVSTKAGTTFDGTNNTATFGTTGNIIELMSVATNQWTVIYNSGVVLSSV